MPNGALWGDRTRNLSLQEIYQVILTELKSENPYLNLKGKSYNCNMICSLSLYQTVFLSGGVAYRMGLCVCVRGFFVVFNCPPISNNWRYFTQKSRLDFSVKEKIKIKDPSTLALYPHMTICWS